MKFPEIKNHKIFHGFNTADVFVTVYELVSDSFWHTGIMIDDLNHVTVSLPVEGNFKVFITDGQNKITYTTQVVDNVQEEA